MNKANNKILTDLYLADQCTKYPNFPIDKMAIRKYTDKTANGLTKCIIDFLNYSKQQAERISVTGRVLDNRKTFVDTVGRSRTIGSTQYIPSTSTKGSADISSIMRSAKNTVVPWKIEVKMKDKQSEAQKKYEKHILAAGGHYSIVHNFDEFMNQYIWLFNNK